MMDHSRLNRSPFATAPDTKPGVSYLRQTRRAPPGCPLVKTIQCAPGQNALLERMSLGAPVVRSCNPAANTSAAATSSLAVLLVSLLTNLVLPWSSLRTAQTARDAARRDREHGEIESGPSFTLDRNALISKDASLQRETRGVTAQGRPASRSSSIRKRSQMRADGLPHVADINFMSVALPSGRAALPLGSKRLDRPAFGTYRMRCYRASPAILNPVFPARALALRHGHFDKVPEPHTRHDLSRDQGLRLVGRHAGGPGEHKPVSNPRPSGELNSHLDLDGLIGSCRTVLGAVDHFWPCLFPLAASS